MEKLKGLLKSRKFWAAGIGLGMVVLKAYRPDFPISEEQLVSLVYVLVAYILGVAVEDGLSASATAANRAIEARTALQNLAERN